MGARSGSKQRWKQEEKAKKRQCSGSRVVVLGVERIVGASREGKQSGSRQWKQEMEAECGVERIVGASRGKCFCVCKQGKQYY